MAIGYTARNPRAVLTFPRKAILLIIIAVGAMVRTVLGQASLPNASTVDGVMRQANSYWMANNNVGTASWSRGAYNTGNHRAFRVLGERAYHSWEVSWGNTNQWKIGPEGSGDAD